MIIFSDECNADDNCLSHQTCSSPVCNDLSCVDGGGASHCLTAECRIDNHQLICYCDSGREAKDGTGGANQDDNSLECGKYALLGKENCQPILSQNCNHDISV